MNRFISYMTHHSQLFVAAVAIVVLASGFIGMPFWDEDEPRFAAIAQTMVETGNWTVPLFNGELAVDKPVLMHWCMAACFSVFGMNEIAARLPAALAALLTSLALLRLGTRCFSTATGIVAALAYLGCLLVAIESHAATPDSILVALSTWATLLLVEPFLQDRRHHTDSTKQPFQTSSASSVRVWHAILAGSLLGLGVLCKGPIGYIGPLVVVMGWVWFVQCLSHAKEQPADVRLKDQLLSTLRHFFSNGIPAALRTIQHTQLLIVTVAAVLVAAPWYISVGVQTDWEWTKGFFFVHNVGRFVAPMERHSGGLLFHPLTMLVGFYPWSCFLPLAIFATTRQLWKTWRQGQSPQIENSQAPALSLLLLWMSVWIGGFSLAATKLP
jgi:4-amino-4-deoxy-L-arabinose transferase-like glycosyltransferase